MQSQRDTLAKLYRNAPANEKQSSVEGIIFSKDRALQLHALLASYKEKVTPVAPLHVLYCASNDQHQQAYDEVRQIFSNDPIKFTRQTGQVSFKNELLDILARISSDKLFFLVDDIIFVEDVMLADYADFDLRKFVPSLRLGENLQKCYTLQRSQSLPAWQTGISKNEEMLVWQWQQGVFDWAYPLSVDGHIFLTWEIKIITEAVEFSAPNTYEDALQQYKDIFVSRFGVCARKSKIINNPCNRVQSERHNISGKIHHDYLLEQWLAGKQINYRQIYGYQNVSAHQEIVFELVKREEMSNA